MWSIAATSNSIAEDAAGTESAIFSLSGLVAEGAQVSVQINLQDITTDPSDYEDAGAAMLTAANAYSGPGALLFSTTTGVLTYTGDIGGTSMDDLAVPIQPVDDELIEGDESLILSLTNPVGANVGQSEQAITIVDNDRSISLENGVLRVVGTDAADVIHVAIDGPQIMASLTPHGQPLQSESYPIGDVSKIVVIAHGGDDHVSYDGGISASAAFDGGSGKNTLGLTGDQSTFVLAGDLALIEADNFQVIENSSADTVSLVLDAAAIRRLSPTSGVIQIFIDDGDAIKVAAANEWRLTEPILHDGQWMLRASNSESGGNEMIEASVFRSWQNFLSITDVDNSGDVSALDALAVINELASRRYSAPTTGQAAEPTATEAWPGLYFDVNGDGRFSAVDALQVINSLTNQRSGSPEGETQTQQRLMSNSEPFAADTPPISLAGNSERQLRVDIAIRSETDWSTQAPIVSRHTGGWTTRKLQMPVVSDKPFVTQDSLLTDMASQDDFNIRS